MRLRVGALDLDVEVEGGAAPLAIIGPNGAGKTTLLRVIAGAMRPSRGEIEVAGQVLFSSARGVEVPIEARRVGYVPQGYGLFPHLCALDNVAFGLSVGERKRSTEQRRAEALEALGALGCAHLADRLPARLSGGEQQRVALARALVIGPRLLLLDEPLAALDAASRRSVRAFLAERLRALGRPCVVVTHDVRDVEALGAEVVALEGGRVVQRGSVEALRAGPATGFVAEFVGV